MPDQPFRPSTPAPSVRAPRPFVERRGAFRRESDRRINEERVLLARSLDILASERPAEARLAGTLGLLARTVGGVRAAVLSAEPERRIAVVSGSGESPAEAERLAAWLDRSVPMTPSARAASGPTPVLIVVDPTASPGASPRPPASTTFAHLPVPAAGRVHLGFEFTTRPRPEVLARRLPRELARHAAVALSLVTRSLALERELEGHRAAEVQRSRFVSTVAHELRTPLTGVGGYLDLILDGDVDDPSVVREFLERSRGIVETMGDLVGDLLELSRLEAGALQLEPAPLSLSEAIGRVGERLEPLALRRGIRLVTIRPSRLATAIGDRRRVEQIITNLVANALKYGAAGTAVEIEGRIDGGIGVVVVRDEGAGIAADDRERIFERFYRIGGHERITGTGLGLPIARDLARAMGGDLDVASVEGSGSAFVLVLPGPAGATPELVGEALEHALVDEEQRLDERGVLRALESAGRGLPGRTRLRVVPGAGRPGAAPGERTTAARPATPQHGTRLRTIDGTSGRSPDRSPA